MNDTKNENSDTDTNKVNVMVKEKCGIIMPISQLDDCSEQHWIDVKSILTETIETAGFEANLVSNADDIGIIQKRIIQNIYDNPIIICDVSGKNPNVMFELGLRLAFDKPTIIVKDDKTSYSFDTSPIEHITYPRDLRFNKIIDFKSELVEKIKGTYKKAKGDKSFSTFLKHFGKFTVAKLDSTEVSKDEFVLEELKDIRRAINNLSRGRNYSNMVRYEEIDNENSSKSERCRIKMYNLLTKIINATDLSKIENKELLIKKILANKNELLSCFIDAESGPCIRRLKRMLFNEFQIEL